MTSSNGNIFRVTGPLCGEFTGPGEFPAQRPVTRSFDVFFDLRLNKRLSKHAWGWWFETPAWSLWRHRNVLWQFVAFMWHIFLIKHKHVSKMYINSSRWCGTCNWSPSSCKTSAYLFYIVNIMVLKSWRRKRPGHQEPWYWLCWTAIIRSRKLRGKRGKLVLQTIYWYMVLVNVSLK